MKAPPYLTATISYFTNQTLPTDRMIAYKTISPYPFPFPLLKFSSDLIQERFEKAMLIDLENKGRKEEATLILYSPFQILDITSCRIWICCIIFLILIQIDYTTHLTYSAGICSLLYAQGRIYFSLFFFM